MSADEREQNAVHERNAAITTGEQTADSTGGRDARMRRDHQEGPKFTLKNGDQIDARWAILLYDRLRAMQAVHPKRLKSLLALAPDRPNDVPTDHLELFKEGGLADSAGAISPDVRGVLLSSYQQTPDGPVLTNPVRFASAADRAAVERINRELNQRFRSFLDERDEDGPSLN